MEALLERMVANMEQQNARMEQQDARMEQLMKKLTTEPTTQPCSQNVPTPSPQAARLEELAQAIQTFHYDPEEDQTFANWWDRYGDIFEKDAAQWSDDTRSRLLLRKLDEQAYQRLTHVVAPVKPKDMAFNALVDQLKEVFTATETLFNIRHNILRTKRIHSEDVATYGARINHLSQKFQFKTMEEDEFKCLLFVSGLSNPGDEQLRTVALNKMSQDPALKLMDLVKECGRVQTVNMDKKLIADKPTPTQTFAVDKRRLTKQATKKVRTAWTRQCWNCKGDHHSRECTKSPARCSQCHQKGHIQEFCDKAKKSAARKINSVRVSATSGSTATTGRAYTTIKINEDNIRFLVDTAADITVIAPQTWKSLGSPPLDKPDVTARTATGEPRSLKGVFKCTYQLGSSQTQHGCCYVWKETEGADLLGLPWLKQIGFMDMTHSMLQQIAANVHSLETQKPSFSDDIRKMFPHLTDGSHGHCRTMKAQLTLKKDAKPKFCRPRPVPFHAEATIDEELDRLQAMGTLSKIQTSSWAAPIVVVKKANGKLRVCADFSTGLNEALEDYHHPLPLPASIFATLSGGVRFSQIDLRDAYLQVELDEDSRKLAVINTHRGLFAYNRLAFGIKSAPGIFQQIMDTVLAGAAGAAAYLDDVIVTGRTIEEHDKNVLEVLRRLNEAGFRLQMEKCSFGLEQIKYLGRIISKEGHLPDPKKTEAIKKMPQPEDASQLRSFLGMVNYYASFVPNLHRMRAPLDGLLKKDVEWYFGPDQMQAVEAIKNTLLSDLLLVHYDPNLPIVVAADASQYGIGYVISHRFPDGTEKAVAHAARTLSDAERNYSQIEKEGLALVSAVRKFHRMIWGRRFTLLTDHMPLLKIFGSKTGIPSYTAARLQRWATTLLGYEFNIEYRRTTEFGQADALSRLIAERSMDQEDAVIAAFTSSPNSPLLDGLPVTHEEVTQATEEDEDLCLVKKLLSEGRLDQLRNSPLQCFYLRRQELSVFSDCLMLADRVVLPAKLRRRMLKQLHRGHPGMERMKRLARKMVFWPQMNEDVEDFVRSCAPCANAAKKPELAPLSSWNLPTKPWQRLHIDFAGPLDDIWYLIVVDALSKWPEVIPMKTTTSKKTTEVLDDLFTQHGLPEVLVSDNGSQFCSEEFSLFCLRRGIQHIKSPPYHPQSNGQAERFVDTFKRTTKKLLAGGGRMKQIINEFLSAYRTTPRPDGTSPAEKLMGRKFRTVHDMINPVEASPIRKDRRMETAFNKQHRVKDRRFRPGDTVQMSTSYGFKRTPDWKDATVLRRLGSRMYLVEADGRRHRRHINQLRKRFHYATDDADLHLLLDAFKIPKQTTAVDPLAEQQLGSESSGRPDDINEDRSQTGPNDAHTQPPDQGPPLRRSQRHRRAPLKLILDPGRKRYLETRQL
ncbi:hypothetical protein QR680_014328 [Steinernema hermaphroditum]|uniref:RNA-directed DNA polymerase n=1 Tax=Steinernema hermaphroditum TaxID=289476 RepID=A0AA39IB51_9BILA|nr:hypothetical protein QR680_014328 [Steinernema hermaphroditum]